MPRNPAQQAAQAERKRIDQVKERMTKAAELYRKKKKQYDRVTGLDGGQGYDEIYMFLKTYENIIREYENLQPEQRGSTDIETVDLRMAFAQYFGNVAVNRPQDSRLSAAMNEKSVLTAQGETAPQGMRDVTDAQKAGLNAIAQWMYRNSKEKHRAFINGILRKSDREKLYMYYLIEKKRRKNATPADFYNSQAENYVPNLDAFKDQMVASKLMVWKRLKMGGKIYWSKLEDAAHVSADSAALYRAYTGQEPDPFVLPAPQDDVAEQGDQQENPQENQQQNQQENQQQNQQENQQENEPAQQNNAPAQQNANAQQNGNGGGFGQTDEEKLLEERQAAANDVLAKLKNHQKNLAKMESKGSRTQEDNNTLAASGRGVEAAFRRLIAADKAITARLGNDAGMERMGEAKPKPKPQKAKKTKEVAGEIKDYTKKIAQGPVKEANNINKNYISWQLNDTLATSFNYTGYGLNSLMGVTTLIGAVAEFITIKQGWAGNMGSTNALNLIGAINKLITGLNDTVGNTLNILGDAGVNFIEKGGEISKEVTKGVVKTGGAYVSIVAGAVDMGVGITKMVRANNSQKKISTSINAYNSRKNRALGPQGPEELTNDDRREMNLQKKLNRDFTAQKVGAGLDIAAGALKAAGGILTLTGVGALAGAIVASAGFVLGWASTIAQWVIKKKNKEKAVDDYIGLDEVMNAVKAALGNNWEGEIKRLGMKNEDALRKQVRLELMARINCRNVDSAYRYIIGQYARMLYRKLFFRKDGRMITAADIGGEDPECVQIREEFVSIAKSLKIRPVYPATADGKPKPDVGTLMAKLS